MFMIRTFLAACLFVFAAPWDAWAQATRSIDLMAYRTRVSPGSPEQDLLLIQRIVPMLARAAYPVMEGKQSTDFQAIDVETRKRPRVRADPRKGQRVDVEFNYTLRVTGDVYQTVTEQFLNWRRSYEAEWIASASSEAEIGRTPLQLIAEDPRLNDHQKAQQVIALMNRRSFQYVPPPTPNPAYWPVSDVIPIRDLGVSIQFNPRGGKVVVLEESTGKTQILPFDPWDDPEDWRRDFEAWAAGQGIESSTEFARKRASSVARQPNSIEDFFEAQHQRALRSAARQLDNGGTEPSEGPAPPPPLEPVTSGP